LTFGPLLSGRPLKPAGNTMMKMSVAFFPPCQKPSKKFMLRSGEVETVKVHYFVPHRYKVVQELLLRVLTSIDFRQGPEL